VKKTAREILRYIYITLGCGFVALGVVGIFVPVLPTTPFLLLAAALFARSSERFHQWLLANRTFGPIIYEWQEYRSMPHAAKKKAIVIVVLTFCVSLYFVPLVEVRWLLVVLGMVLVLFLARIPSRQ
jgi:uncharacterized membrane protein YbaN (DUF454 family)